MSGSLPANPASLVTQGAPSPAKPRRRRPFQIAQASWTIPVVLALLVFFVGPLAGSVIRSFAGGRTAELGPFTYYTRLFTDSFYLGIIGQTLLVGVVVTLVSLVIGYPVAYFIVRFAGRWSGLITFCLIAPLLTSVVMRTFGWRVLLARRGLVNLVLQGSGIMPNPPTWSNEPIAVYLGVVHVVAPFMVMSIVAVLRTVDVRLEEAARVLGAGRLQTFRRVTLPLSVEGMVTGSILVFVLTNGSFLTMLLLGGGSVRTLALLIYQQFNLTQDAAFASAMGNVLLLLALGALFLQNRLVRRRASA